MKKEIIIIVCGGRHYNDYIKLHTVLTELNNRVKISTIIHGDANGADRMAGFWAEQHSINAIPVPADWSGLHCAAGRIRNKKMLDMGIGMGLDGVVAFPGGNGTRHMISIAKKAGLPVWEIHS